MKARKGAPDTPFFHLTGDPMPPNKGDATVRAVQLMMRQRMELRRAYEEVKQESGEDFARGLVGMLGRLHTEHLELIQASLKGAKQIAPALARGEAAVDEEAFG